MKYETKEKVIAVAGGVSFSAFIFTIGLVLFEHPAQWALAGVCMLGFGVALFVGSTID